MKKSEKYYSFIVALIAFFVYVITLAPSVVQIDAGELAAVQATLGIAHPTGYPLFTVTGYLFSLIPLPLSAIIKLNLLAAIWTSFGLFFFVKSAEILTLKIFGREKLNKGNASVYFIFIAAAAFTLAFSRTYWLQSGSVEVYSLQIFLFNLILWQSLKTSEDKNRNEEAKWLLLAVYLALGFANHMTTLLLLPGIAFLFFEKEGFNKKALLTIGKMLAVFFPLLAVFYSYLPLRAASKPLLNWGNPVNLENFWRHFTGKQYQVWLFASIESAKKQLAYFFSNLPNEFTSVGILLSLLGLHLLFIKNRTLFYFLLINFLFTIFYSINYDINDIDSYFLLAYINFALFILFGFIRVFDLMQKVKNRLHYSAAISVVVVIILFVGNYKYANQNDLHTFEDYTEAAIGSLPQNSILFTYQWDYLVSPSYYLQFVENFRRDVKIIDKELLRRSWYYEQLRSNYPGLLSGLKKETEGFLKAVAPFERNKHFDAGLLEKYYRAIMTKLISTNIDSCEYFIGPEIIDNEFRRKEFSLPEGLFLAPGLFFFKVVKPNEYYEAPLPEYKIRFPNYGNKYTDMLKNILSAMLVRRALYELSFQKTERAKIYVNKLKRDFPDYRIPVSLRNLR